MSRHRSKERKRRHEQYVAAQAQRAIAKQVKAEKQARLAQQKADSNGSYARAAAIYQQALAYRHILVARVHVAAQGIYVVSLLHKPSQRTVTCSGEADWVSCKVLWGLF